MMTLWEQHGAEFMAWSDRRDNPAAMPTASGERHPTVSPEYIPALKMGSDRLSHLSARSIFPASALPCF